MLAYILLTNADSYRFVQIFDYWENTIAKFTSMVYSMAIVLASSGGDPAPLVGHNVLLRWSAMQVRTGKGYLIQLAGRVILLSAEK